MYILLSSGTRPFQLQDVFSLENEDSDDMTLIDKKVFGILSSFYTDVTHLFQLQLMFFPCHSAE